MGSVIVSDVDMFVTAQEKPKLHVLPKKTPWKMYLAALATLLFPLSMGMAASYSATATENMREPSSWVRPSADEISWIGSLLALGALVGGLTSGHLCNKIGRKKTLILNTVPFLTGWTLIAYATSIWCVYAGRLLTGYCCGLICVAAPPYLVEISTLEVRGLFGAGFQLFGAIGTLFVCFLGLFMTWNWQAMVGAMIVVLSLWCMCFMPESPRWLVAQGKYDMAIKSLIFLQGKDFDAISECASIQKDLSQQPKEKIKLKDLRDPLVYKPMVFSIGLMFFQQFCGSMAIISYTAQIFKEFGSALKPVVATVVVDVVLVLATALSTSVMNKVGRKILLLMSGAGMAFSLFLLGLYDYLKTSGTDLSKYNHLPLICIIIYLTFMSLGIGTIPWLMTAEMSPARLRGTIGGIAAFSCWLFVFTVSKTFQDIRNVMHGFGAYWLYAAFSVLQCIFAMLLPETKGKSFEEIRHSLQAPIFSSKEKKIDKKRTENA